MTQPDDTGVTGAPEPAQSAADPRNGDDSVPTEAAPLPQYHSEEAYSRAIEQQKPRAQIPPGAVASPTGSPAPAKSSSAGRTLLVTLVAVASLMALVITILFVAISWPSRQSGGTGNVPQADAAQAQFKVDDCLYDVAGDAKVGNCTNGGSPYRVVQVMPIGQDCKPGQPSIALGRSYCLTPNLNINYCYTSPGKGGWIQPATRCAAPGTVTVVSVVPGKKNDKLCRGAWTNSYFYSDPPLTVCVKEY